MLTCFPQVDVFSFGIVLWELLTGEEPYADLHYGVIIGGYKSSHDVMPSYKLYVQQIDKA